MPEAQQITYKGQTRTLLEWAKITGIKKITLYQRINVLGWSAEDALTIPPKGGSRLLTFNGKTQSIHAWAIEYGVRYATLYQRIVQQGLPLEEALKGGKRGRKALNVLTYNGKTQSMVAWARELGVSYAVLNNRLLNGWSVERTLSTPKKSARLINLGGKSRTLREWSKELDMPYGVLTSRIQNGWSDVEALTIPIAPRRSRLRK